VETDPWGLSYKLVTKKLIGRRPIPGHLAPGRADSIIDFPREIAAVWPQNTENYVFPEVTCAEIRELGNRIPYGNAPGLNGVPDLVIKEVARVKPEILRDVYNKCPKDWSFPHSWKMAKLVLLGRQTA